MGHVAITWRHVSHSLLRVHSILTRHTDYQKLALDIFLIRDRKDGGFCVVDTFCWYKSLKGRLS